MAEAVEEVCNNSLNLARLYSQKMNYARAFSHYLVHCKLRKENSTDSSQLASDDEVLSTLKNLANILIQKGCTDQAKEAYRQGLILYPQSFDLHLEFALLLVKNDEDINETKFHLEKCRLLQPDNLVARHHAEAILVSMLERWHFSMLNDVGRNCLFERAIDVSVKRLHRPNDELTILDVGTGSGILALYAANAVIKNGIQSQIFACEVSPAMLETAEEVLTLNGREKEVHLIPKLSTDITRQDLNKKDVDLMITETFDAGLFGEHVLEILDHAWNHLLNQTSRVLPCLAKVFIAPIDSEYVRNQTYVQTSRIGYLNLERLEVKAQWVKEEPYSCENMARISGGFHFLSDPQELLVIDFQDPAQVKDALKHTKLFSRQFKIRENGKLSGIALWFQLVLDKDETLIIDTQPGSPHCWDQAIYPVIPFEHSLENDVIEVKFELKEHLKMKSCKFIAQKNPTKLSEMKTHLFLPGDAVAQLNDVAHVLKLQQIAQQISRDNFNAKSLEILDVTFSCAVALQILISNSRSRLTVLIDANDDNCKSRIDFVSECADANNVSLNRINCTSLSEETSSRESYDLVFLEPILSNGKLDHQLWTDILPKLNTCSSQFTCFPWRISLFCLLVESDELLSKCRMIDDSSCGGFRISSSVNKYSVRHQQDLTLSSLSHKALSEPTYIHSFDLREINSHAAKETHSAVAKLTQPGTIHALVYWFVLEYGWDMNVSTCEGSFKQAAIVVDPTAVDPESSLTAGILFHHHQGLVDFEVHC